MQFRAFMKITNKLLPTACFVQLLIWFLGLVLGLHIASAFDDVYYTFYSTAAREPAGLVGLLAVFFLPFLTFLLATRYKKMVILPAIVLATGFVFGYNLSMLNAAFGAGAWLARMFLLFSYTFKCFLLILLIYRYNRADPLHFKIRCIIYSITSVVLSLIDFFFVSKFISSIL